MTNGSSEWHDMPTVDLVRLSQEGRGEAREELFGRYSERVQNIVRVRLGKRLRSAVDSCDVVQEVMGEAFSRLDGFEMRDDSSLLRWLSRITENTIRNRAAYQGALKRNAVEVPLDAPGPAGSESMRLPLPDTLPTPSVEVGRAEEAHTVRECIAELPERYREAILVRDYTGAAWDDVAREIGVATPDAARMLYSRALSKLGELLRRRGLE